MHEKLKQYMKVNGLNNPDIAKQFGVGATTISQYVNGKYKGDVKRLDKLTESLLSTNQVHYANKDDFDFVETSVYKSIDNVVRTVLNNREMRVITGQSGVGKTTALEHLKEVHGERVIHFQIYKGMSKKTFLRRLAKAAGVKTKYNSFDDTFEAIEDKLDGWHGVIMLDEVEHLNIAAIDAVRRLHEFVSCGVVLVGLPKFRDMLKKNRWDYDYIYNRLSIPLKLTVLKGLDLEEMAATMTDYNPGGKKWFEVSKGIGRDLKFIIREFKRVKAIPQNAELSPLDILQSVVKNLERD